MPDLLIKGQEMPITCFYCACMHFNEGLSFCAADAMLRDVAPDCKPDWYPLVEVPTHGRLIDADKLYKKVKTECNPYGKPSISYVDGLIVLDLIDDAPTVIEASEDHEPDE